MTIDDIYAFVELTIKCCREHGDDDIAQQLDDALNLGSSGLEILGAVKMVFIAQKGRLARFIDKSKLQDVIEYVDKAYGID